MSTSDNSSMRHTAIGLVDRSSYMYLRHGRLLHAPLAHQDAQISLCGSMMIRVASRSISACAEVHRPIGSPRRQGCRLSSTRSASSSGADGARITEMTYASAETMN